MFLRFRGGLLNSLLHQGVDVLALVGSTDADSVGRLRALGVEAASVGVNRGRIVGLSDLAMLFRLIKKIKKYSPDVVFSYSTKSVVASGLAAKLFPETRFYSMISGLGYAFSDEVSSRSISAFLRNKLMALSLSKQRAVVFQNPDDKNELVSLGIVRPDKCIQIAGSGVDLDTFREAEPAKGEILQFTMISRLVVSKGVRIFIEAARIIQERLDNASFVLVGQFDSHPDAIPKEEIEQAVRDGVIEYMGVVSDVRPILASTSVFVLPSWYREGVPRTALEAMAMGRAVITTDSPGCRETVVHGHNGFLVPPRDVDALVGNMMRFIEMPALVVEMGKRGREIAEKKFDMVQNNQVILAMLNGRDTCS